MLRTIQNRHLLPRLLSFVSDNDGADVTASWGALLGAYTRPGAGINRLTLSSPVFHRAPILVCTPGADLSLGGYGVLGADPTYQVLDPKALDESGTAEDGVIHSLSLGWLSSSTDWLDRKQPIHTVFDRPRLIGLKVTGGASPSMALGAADASVALTGATAGDYTITFRRPFNQVPNVVASLSGTVGGVRIQSVTRSTVRVIAGTAAGAAAHRTINLIVMGSDGYFEQNDIRRHVKAPHIGPELVGFHISVSGGSPSLTIGGSEGSVSDDGTGDFTFTFGRTFGKTVIPVCIANNRVYTANEDTNSFDINCTDASGTPADPTDVQGLVLVYSDSNDYYQDL